MSQLHNDTSFIRSTDFQSVQDLEQTSEAKGTSSSSVQNASASAGAEQLRSPEHIRRQVLQERPALDTTLRNRVKPGLLTRISCWFRERKLANAGLAETYTFQLKGKPLTLKGEIFQDMIKSLDSWQRAEARERLPQIIQARLEKGSATLNQILSGERNPALSRATVQEAADIMLVIRATNAQISKDFTFGSYNIEDPQGKLFQFLDSCPELYQRSSTHLNDLQKLGVNNTLDQLGAGSVQNGHLNTQRGIDIPAGPESGIPGGHGTMVFGVIQGCKAGDPPRLFLKTETYGCRISTLSNSKKSLGIGQTPDREWKVGDALSAIAHGARLVKVKKSGRRPEKTPKPIVTAYKNLMANSRLSENERSTLSRNHPLSDGGGIRVMQDNIKALIHTAARSGNMARQAMLRDMTASFRLALEQNLTVSDPAQLPYRIGDECVLQARDLA